MPHGVEGNMRFVAPAEPVQYHDKAAVIRGGDFHGDVEESLNCTKATTVYRIYPRRRKQCKKKKTARMREPMVGHGVHHRVERTLSLMVVFVIWYGMVRYGAVWYGMVWYGMICGMV